MQAAERRKAFDYIRKTRTEFVSFLCEYISKRPVNPEVLRFQGLDPGEGELEAQNWLTKKLGAMGFKVEQVVSAPRRPNVVGVLKRSGSGRPLILNGHTDVVPVLKNQDTRWTVDPWKGTVRKDRVYGRGSSDMLGGNVAMIWAAKAMLDTKAEVGGDVILQCVVGEESNEGGSVGTAAVVDAGFKAPFAVVCEPTSLDIQPITNGTFLFQLEVEGLEGHTGSKNMIAYPQPYGVPHGDEVMVDAIEKMTKFLSAFKDLERRWAFRYRHPLFGSGNDRGGIAPFTITATLIEGGPYAASIPGYCKATFQVYFPPFVKAKDAWREIKRTAEAVCMTDDWLSRKPPNLKITSRIWEPSETPIENEGCRALIASYVNVFNERPRLAGMKAVSDATYLGKKGIPSVVFGPGDLHAGVHGPNESIRISNMVACCKVYCEMISNWCGAV